jgi:16S rRNA (cytidine1402-2'-O)-methyltransferase
MKPGTLYVVATPIGNLGDITVRALEVLRSVELIACEDTRRSRILLQHWKINTKLVSVHRFSESRKVELILGHLKHGEDVALISDAGSPAVSDPGSRLVRAALEEHLTVTPIPGPSAVTAALSASGADGSTFVFLGFVPKKEALRRDFFAGLRKEARPAVFFETGKRILATLETAAELLGPRRLVLFRELTKLHEETLDGTPADLLERLSTRESIRGEIVVVADKAPTEGSAVSLDEAVTMLAEEGLSGRALVEEARRRFGLRKADAYRGWLDVKGRGQTEPTDD